MKAKYILIALLLTIGLIGCKKSQTSETTVTVNTQDTINATKDVLSLDADEPENTESQNEVENTESQNKVDITESENRIELTVSEDLISDDESLDDIEGFTPTDIDVMNKVDSYLEIIAEDDSFKKADIEGRYNIMKEALDKLESDGLVTDIHYDESTHLFSYNYANGLSAGWLISDFDPMMN